MDGSLKYVLTLDTSQGQAALSRFNAVVGAADQRLAAMAGASRGGAGAMAALQGSLAAALPVVSAVSAAMAVLTAGATAFGKGLRLAATAEQTSVAFKTLSGSAKEAAAIMSMLSKMAIETPFKEADLQGAARALLAARVPAGALKQELQALGNIASATNGDIGRLAIVYAQVAGKGRLYTEELQQFVEQGFGALKPALEAVLEVTSAELQDMLQKGEVGFSTFRAALLSLAGAAGSWGNGMAEQSQTNLGLLSSLSDNVEKLLLLLAKPISDGPIKAWLTNAVEVTQKASQVMAAAISQGQIKDALMNAIILGAKLGANGFIDAVQNMGSSLAKWAKDAVELVKGIMSGSVEAVAQAAVAIATFDWSKGGFDTTAEENYFKNLIAGANAASVAIKKPAKAWADALDSTTEEEDGGGSGSGSGKGSKAKKPTAYTDSNMALPLVPRTAEEAKRMLKDVPPDLQQGLPALPTSADAARKVLEKPLAVQPVAPDAIPAAAPTTPQVPTVTASTSGADAGTAQAPSFTMSGALERGASVAAAAAKEPSKIKGYSARTQGGADAARVRADVARYQRQDHLYAGQAVFGTRPAAAAEAVQAAVSGGRGGGSSATASGPDSGNQALVTKLEELKAELVRIRTE